MRKKNLWFILSIGILCCAAMALVDGVIRPGYVIKSVIKITLFLGLPLLVALWQRELSCLGLFRIRRSAILPALGLGLGVYCVILLGFFLVRRWFDFGGIAESLTQNAGVTADNFLYISLYISFINSLLEEFFFRGFVSWNLKKLGLPKLSYLYGGILFALYHVAMLTGWFSPILFWLVMAGLSIGGFLFHWLNEKLDCIWGSWLVHMFANFAINTIGFLLL